MKLFYDLLPIFIFFIAYKLYGIFVATATAIVATLILMMVTLFRRKRPDLMQIITLVLIVLLGGATLLFKNETFIKWKPTVVYWVMGLIFAITPFFSQKTLVQKMLDRSLTLPQKAWSQLNISWYAFFFLMGLINLMVVYSFDTDVWVNFKLFGTLGFTIIFVIIQGILISRNFPQTSKQQKNSET